MGSPRAFELRRAELGGDAVRDAEVVASFRESVGPDGLLTEYIKHARLALILGNTLFVHGAVCERSARHVPHTTPLSPTAYRTACRIESSSTAATTPASSTSGLDLAVTDGPRTWVQKLHAWKEQQVAEWCEFPFYNNTARTRRGGEALMDYGVPGGAAGRGVPTPLLLAQDPMKVTQNMFAPGRSSADRDLLYILSLSLFLL